MNGERSILWSLFTKNVDPCLRMYCCNLFKTVDFTLKMSVILVVCYRALKISYMAIFLFFHF